MSELNLFLCGVAVILVVIAAIVTMVSTIYQMAQRDERELMMSEGRQDRAPSVRRKLTEASH